MELLHFEDLPLGGSWTTRGRTLTESDIINHAATSGDWGPLHVDQEAASGGHFGTRVAHGALLVSLALGLGAMDIPQPATVGLVGTGWRFMRPVRIGDTIRAHYRLSRKRDVDEPRWGLVSWRIEITNQRQEIVAEGEITVLVARRDVPQLAPATALSKRRRRGRRGKEALPPPSSAGAPSAEANLPDPAPSDAPAPRARRRPSTPRPQPDPVEEVVPAAVPPAEESPQPAPSARRRRRRRGGGGGSGQGSGGATAGGGGSGSTQDPDLPLPVPPTAEHPVYVPVADADSSTVLMTTPGPVLGAPTGDDNPIGQILKRFRRPRQAAPRGQEPGGTR